MTAPTRASIHERAERFAREFFEARRVMKFHPLAVGQKDQMQAEIREANLVAQPVDLVMLFATTIATSIKHMLDANVPEVLAYAAALDALTTIYAELVLADDTPKSDALAAFPAWDGADLGPNEDGPLGFGEPRVAEGPGLFFAGAWVSSSAYATKDRALNPAVHMRVIARDTTDPSAIFRVIEGTIPADVAAEWGEFLAKAAERAPHDVVAMEERS